MQSFKWTRLHAIFLPEVDAEHRNLFCLAQELEDAARGEARPEHALAVARPFVAALEEHFAHEERIMREANYEIRDWHKMQHDLARDRATAMLHDVEAGSVEAARVFLAFLAKWFRDHMAVSDRMMGAHLRNYERCRAIAS